MDGTGLQSTHIQGGSDNTAPFPRNHPYISSCKLQLGEISTAAKLLMYSYRGGNDGAVLSLPPCTCTLVDPCMASLHSFEIIFILLILYYYNHYILRYTMTM